MPQTAWVSSSWCWSYLGDKMPAWESACRLRACGAQWPMVEQLQPRWGTSAAMVRRTLGQYVAVSPRLQLTSHTQPTSTLSRIKCERYYFIKKWVRSFIEVVIMFDYIQHIFVYELCMRLYDSSPLTDFFKTEFLLFPICPVLHLIALELRKGSFAFF